METGVLQIYFSQFWWKKNVSEQRWMANSVLLPSTGQVEFGSTHTKVSNWTLQAIFSVSCLNAIKIDVKWNSRVNDCSISILEKCFLKNVQTSRIFRQSKCSDISSVNLLLCGPTLNHPADLKLPIQEEQYRRTKKIFPNTSKFTF